MAANKVYDYITDRILASLEKGVIPWKRPWRLKDAAKNLVSGKAYRGVNAFSLGMSDHTSSWWLTYNQCKARGGQVRKGEKGSMIVFWKTGDKRDGSVDAKGRPQKFFMLRYSTVFNVEQCDNLEYPKPEATEPIDTIAACEAVIGGFLDCPPITHGGDRAFYRFTDDTLTMPPLDTFVGSEEYYSVLFHECGHATGHKTRLDRDLNGYSGSSSYASEELIAEMTAAFLCGTTGIECKTIENSAAYIQNWLKALRNDHKLVVTAATKAQAAAEYIQDIAPPKYDDDKSDSKVAPVESDAMALAGRDAEYAGAGHGSQ